MYELFILYDCLSGIRSLLANLSRKWDFFGEGGRRVNIENGNLKFSGCHLVSVVYISVSD